MATTKNPYSDIDLSIYANGYQESDIVKEAAKKKQQAEEAVKNYGDFAYKNQGALDLALQNLQNRKFSYDLNADALYQQYKDNYITQGKQASIDVMGQAAAMTGGYGNSYAATVGNQTYQGYLTQLNNIAPELYKLALDKYNSEGADLTNQVGVLQSDKQMEYGIWGDKKQSLIQDRDYYSSDYDAAYGRDYTAWNDNRSYDTSQYWNEYNAGYQKEQDAIAQQQWEKEFKLAQDQFNYQKSQKSGSGNGGNSGTTTDTSKVPQTVLDKLGTMSSNGKMTEYLNGLVSSGTITQEQAQSLYAQYRSEFGDFELVDDGGTNWFGGVDGNAKYRVYNHSTGKYETLTGDQLVQKYGKEKALEIQKQLGA